MQRYVRKVVGSYSKIMPMWTPGGLLFEYNFNTVSNMNRLVQKLAEALWAVPGWMNA